MRNLIWIPTIYTWWKLYLLFREVAAYDLTDVSEVDILQLQCLIVIIWILMFIVALIFTSIDKEEGKNEEKNEQLVKAD